MLCLLDTPVLKCFYHWAKGKNTFLLCMHKICIIYTDFKIPEDVRQPIVNALKQYDLVEFEYVENMPPDYLPYSLHL